jgi:flagellar FliL protein
MAALLKPRMLVPLAAAGLMGLFVAYILFAPPTMWKPVYVQFQSGTPAEAQQAVPSPTPEPRRAFAVAYRPGQGILYDLGQKIVNLAEPGGRRYLQVGIVLECLPDDPAFYELKGEARKKAEEEAMHELDALKPALNDAVISILTSKTFAEIFTVEGKSQLKQEIMAEVNGLLGYDKVAAVYFTEFLVQ